MLTENSGAGGECGCGRPVNSSRRDRAEISGGALTAPGEGGGGDAAERGVWKDPQGCAGEERAGVAGFEGEGKKLRRSCWQGAQETWNRFPLELNGPEVPVSQPPEGM